MRGRGAERSGWRMARAVGRSAKGAAGGAYLQVGGHPVSGYAAWRELAEGMVSAPEKPPHFNLIKEFWAGPDAPPFSVNVCHVIEGEENLKAVSALFAPGGPMVESLKGNPVVGEPMTFNQFEIRVTHCPEAAVEDGMVLGVYSHGVPDAEAWCDMFAADQVSEMHAKMGIIKSFGGPMVGDCAWAPAGAEGVMVIHVFPDAAKKRDFDLIFDPTAGMFKEMVESGAAVPPFNVGAIGPVWKF